MSAAPTGLLGCELRHCPFGYPNVVGPCAGRFDTTNGVGIPWSRRWWAPSGFA